MKAYHGDLSIKEFYLARVRAHAAADEIVHGRYWENGKGCAVGCTVHSSSHKEYEIQLGIPYMIARLEDGIFEGMANGKSKEFPEKFLLAISPGADLSRVHWKFLYWLLTEELAGRDHPRVVNQIKACADILIPLTKGELVDIEAAHKARGEARIAADAAYAAAADAAGAAAGAAADAAAYAAGAAAYAAYAAYAAAADAAGAAAADAAGAAAGAAADAADATRRACYERMAEKLLELLRVES